MSRIFRAALLLGTAALALSLSACANGNPSSTPTAASQDALISVWTLDKTFDSPEQPYIAFTQDGIWSSSDGCNRVVGTWDLAADGTLTTTAGPSTLMACDGAQLPLAVSRATRVDITGDTMVLYSSFDSTETTLVRNTDPKVGPQGLPIGEWVESDKAIAPFLTISADGKFSGNDGCNTLLGTWSFANEQTSFSGVASTLMACQGVDTWLSALSTATVQNGVMTVQSEDGSVLGQLQSK